MEMGREIARERLELATGKHTHKKLLASYILCVLLPTYYVHVMLGVVNTGQETSSTLTEIQTKCYKVTVLEGNREALS